MKGGRLVEDPRDIARRYLAEAANGSSIGTWGAIGESQDDPDEPCLMVDLAVLSVASPRGSLHIGELADVTLFALVDEVDRTREIASPTRIFASASARLEVHQRSRHPALGRPRGRTATCCRNTSRRAGCMAPARPCQLVYTAC